MSKYIGKVESFLLENYKYSKETSEVFNKDDELVTGHKSGIGYLALSVTVNKVSYQILMHRVVWFLHYGKWPSKHLDHINRVKTDNRIRNLRQATVSDNLKNQGLSKRNTSGFKGVSWSRFKRKWKVSLGLPIGEDFDDSRYFESRLDAAEFYDILCEKLHGNFAVTNRSLGLL